MVTLIVLDGFGIRKEKFGNAIKSQGTPYLDKLTKQYPHTILQASGKAVGLPDGVMGNSEVGHLTLGTGRVTLQDLQQINNDVETGKIFENPALIKALTHAEKNKSNLHLMGLFSDIGVHADINHMFKILDLAKNYEIKNIYLHLFTDGRDCGVTDSLKYLETTNQKIEGTNAKIATISGRLYAMDREKRFNRLQLAYDAITQAKGERFDTAKQAIETSHKNGVTDEFFVPAVVDPNGAVSDNDSVIFYNLRADRARELTQAFTDENFAEFETKKLNNVLFTPMREYAKEFAHLNTLYPQIKIEDNLASQISKAGKKQFHIAETTKYAHVTFYFNGGIENPYEGEDRKLIESFNVADFAQTPKMKAPQITEKVVEAITTGKYDFILVNYSNPDMVGHTGNFNSTKQAIECVDKQAYIVALATLMAGGECLIVADHGNAEDLIDEKGNKVTSHTTNPVPAILVSNKHKKAKLKKNKTLANVAATVLKLMDLPIPDSYEEALF